MTSALVECLPRRRRSHVADRRLAARIERTDTESLWRGIDVTMPDIGRLKIASVSAAIGNKSQRLILYYHVLNSRDYEIYARHGISR